MLFFTKVHVVFLFHACVELFLCSVCAWFKLVFMIYSLIGLLPMLFKFGHIIFIWGCHMYTFTQGYINLLIFKKGTKFMTWMNLKLYHQRFIKSNFNVKVMIKQEFENLIILLNKGWKLSTLF